MQTSAFAFTIALLLNEVSEKKEIETKFPKLSGNLPRKIAPKFQALSWQIPKFQALSWQIQKVLPPNSPDLSQFGRGGETPTPKISALPRNDPFQ